MPPLYTTAKSGSVAFLGYDTIRVAILTCAPKLTYHRHNCRVAGEGRRVVASPCPRLTARLQRSQVGRMESFRSWSSHLFSGRPGWRRHVRSGGRLMGLLQLRYEHDSSTIRLRFGYNTLQHATRFFVRSHTRSYTRISGRRVLHVD